MLETGAAGAELQKPNADNVNIDDDLNMSKEEVGTEEDTAKCKHLDLSFVVGSKFLGIFRRFFVF